MNTLKKLVSRLYYPLHGYRRIARRFYAKRPVSVRISKQSSVRVDGFLRFNISQTPGLKVKTCGYLSLAGSASLVCGGTFDISAGCRLGVMDGARLKLGSGYMNYDCKIYCFQQITIGSGAAISEGVIIRDSDNHAIAGSDKPVCAPITIGDGVWIGMNAVILKGVTIGSGSVIAAGALVNSDIPDHCLAAGVPARVIRQGIEWK